MMDYLAAKDQRDGKLTGRTTWENDRRIRKELKKRAITHLLEFEENRERLNKQVLLLKFILIKS